MRKIINIIVIVVQFVIIINLVRELVPKNPPVARIKAISEDSNKDLSRIIIGGKIFKKEENDLIYQDIDTNSLESYTLPQGEYFLFQNMIPDFKYGSIIELNKFDLVFMNISP